MSANIHIFIWAVLASRNLDTRLNLWTLTLADILNLLKFSCKNLCINPTHFISVFLSFRQNLLEREDFWNTSLWGFFVCFVLLCIYNYISSSIVPFLYRKLLVCLGTSAGLLRIEVWVLKGSCLKRWKSQEGAGRRQIEKNCNLFQGKLVLRVKTTFHCTYWLSVVLLKVIKIIGIERDTWRSFSQTALVRKGFARAGCSCCWTSTMYRKVWPAQRTEIPPNLRLICSWVWFFFSFSFNLNVM